jgi:PHD/YefM family antitoxin component YafN of YafNO toxin-antitoxin module
VIIADETAREDLEAVAELSDTDYLLRSPANARRLFAAIAELEADRDTERDPRR